MEDNNIETKNKPLPELIHNGTRYKMVIPANVEQKIRFACASVPNQEWSGVLFYTYRGTFEGDDLVITCKDILVMDVGTATYTEWCADAEVIGYMVDNDLLDCQLGIIHSHNTMKAFFSGTDLATLKAEGVDRNNIVSLIVNNEGKYEAALTRLVITTAQVTEVGTYQFFGEGEKEYKDSYETEDIYVEYFMLDIVRKEPKGLFGFIDRMKKVMSARKTSTYGGYNTYGYSKGSYKPVSTTPAKPTTTIPMTTPKPAATPAAPKGPTPPANNIKPMAPDAKPTTATPSYSPSKPSTWMPDSYPTEGLPFSPTADIVAASDVFIEGLALQIVTGNIMLDYNSNVVIDDYVAKTMYNTFKTRFGTDISNNSDFCAWLDGLLDFIVYNSHDEELDSFNLGDKAEIIAEQLHDRLNKLTCKNMYLTTIINRLKSYYA